MLGVDAPNRVGRSLDLSKYRDQRRKIEDALTQIAGVATSLGADLLVQDLHRAIAALKEDFFKLVVVGHFSQGKSTVINALLGTKVLPSSPRPTTAILNRLRHANHSAITLRYLDDSSKGPLSVKEFQAIVAPPEPTPGDDSSRLVFEDRAKELARIAYAEVEHPWALSGDGVEIVDTPGTNDLDPMREKITYDFIPNSDAAIFVLSARAVTAESEIRFLKDRILKADIQRIFFLINFADQIAPGDRSRVVEFARNQLAPIIPNPRIFLVSAKAALAHRLNAQGLPAKGGESMTFEECGYPELEQELGLFLTSERGWIKLAKPSKHGLRLAAELKHGPITIARASLGIDIHEFTARIERLEPEIARLESERDQALRVLATGLADGELALLSMLRRGLEDIADQATALVGSYSGPLTVEDLAHCIEGAIAPQQTVLQEKIRDLQNNLLRDECSRVHRRLARAWDDLYLKIEAIFDPNKECEDGTSRSKEAKPESAWQEPVNTTAHEIPTVLMAGGLLAFLILPFFVLGRVLDKVMRDRFLGRMRFEVDRRYRDGIPETVRDFERNWKATVEKISDNLARECNQNLRTLQDQLAKLRDDRSEQTGRTEERLRELNDMESRLDRASRDLVDAVSPGATS